MSKISKLFVMGAFLALPFVASAQTGLPGVQTSVGTLQNIVNALIPVAFGLAILFFFWGLAKYILAAGSEEGKAEGRNIMIWGVIALFVMVSIWGIIIMIGSVFGIETGTGITPGDINLPGVN